MPDFGIDSPAQTIHDLLDYLRSEHRPGDQYRGQVREYSALIPSMFRAGIVPETADRKMVSVDSALIDKAISAKKAYIIKQQLHSRLISIYGRALGNIISQQYGITSECVDVTEDIKVAGFFATRNWPTYSHHNEPGIGVIYRFRSGHTELLSAHRNDMFISRWFEMGEWDGKYFDVFVHRFEYESHSLDRDKWIGSITPQHAVVSTLPLRLRWAEIYDLIRDIRGKDFSGLWGQFPKYDHRLTRTFNQFGGFIRPRYYWKSEIPSQHKLIDRRLGMVRPYCIGMPEFDESAPWISPSTAIKIRLTGVENLRLRDDCSGFYFKHSNKPVTGLYRRKLWPEPSEDPVYGLLWTNTSIMMLPRDDGTMVPVDDLYDGILDRGYRVTGERQTFDAREISDLMRGQLEDAREAVDSPSPSASDWISLSGGAVFSGDVRNGVRAAINAIRCEPSNVSAGVALAAALWQSHKLTWCRKVLSNIEQFAPNHPELLFSLAETDIEDGNYLSASARLKKALSYHDRSQHDIPRYWILDRLLHTSERLGDNETATFARSALDRYALHGGIMIDDA